MKLTDRVELSNGYSIPLLGFGTWQIPEGDTAVESVKTAIKEGYRHIDGAAGYSNEKSVGKGIRESGVDREELFITSKVKNSDRGYKETLAAFEKTRSDLGLDYLDLYLIHWPASHHRFDNWDEINKETWRAMTELYKAGKIKSIGVSNFLPHHLESLMKTEVPPMVDQIEFNPGHRQDETVKYCVENNIVPEAWSPLGSGRVLNHPELEKLAGEYGRSMAQICLRWIIQKGIVAIPKSTTPWRIRENSRLFDFELSDEDMRSIDSWEEFGGSGLHPDKVDF